MSVAARVVELRRLIDDANHRYHVLDDPAIPDSEYDALMRELELPEREAHNALNDAVMAALAFTKLRHLLGR